MTRRTTNPNLLLPLPHISSPLSRTPSTFTPPFSPSASTSSPSHSLTSTSSRALPLTATRPHSHPHHHHHHHHHPQSLARPETLWSEMQHKLSEVELSNAPIFFGPSHSRALEELRTAQIALAQAWTMDQEPVTASTTEWVEGDDESNVRKRRVASDAHFERVAAGVVDVAGKLENVASAMKGVEMESRGIWDESEADGESMVGGESMESVVGGEGSE